MLKPKTFIKLTEMSGAYTAIQTLVYSLNKITMPLSNGQNVPLSKIYELMKQVKSDDESSYFADVLSTYTNALLPQINRIITQEGNFSILFPIPTFITDKMAYSEDWIDQTGKTNFILISNHFTRHRNGGVSWGHITKKEQNGFIWGIVINLQNLPSFDDFLWTLNHELVHILQFVNQQTKENDPEISNLKQGHSLETKTSKEKEPQFQKSEYFARADEAEAEIIPRVFDILQTPGIKNKKGFEIIEKLLDTYNPESLKKNFTGLIQSAEQIDQSPIPGVLSYIIHILLDSDLLGDTFIIGLKEMYTADTKSIIMKAIEQWAYENANMIMYQLSIDLLHKDIS